MTDSALYHTTAATLSCAKIHGLAAWVLSVVAILVMADTAYHASAWVWVAWVAGLWASLYYHIRVHLDVALLQALAQGVLQDRDLDQALVQLQLRPTPKPHTAPSRCHACLAFWRKSIAIDCVLCCVSSFILIFALST